MERIGKILSTAVLSAVIAAPAAGAQVFENLQVNGQVKVGYTETIDDGGATLREATLRVNGLIRELDTAGAPPRTRPS